MDGARAHEGPWLASAASGDERWSAATHREPGEARLDDATMRDVGLYDGMYGLEPPGPRGSRHRDRRRRARGHILLVLAAAAIAVIVGLTGWMLVSGASAGAPPAPRHSAAAQPRPTTAPMVTVPADLVGQSFTDVVQQLQGLGLKVKVNFVPSDHDDGTVVSVAPAGPVAQGTTIRVTVASHHHHDNGNGNGNGGG
jgi:hypothetical protein